jgi:hypothetical protein
MANTLKFGNGQWATGNGTALAYNDENANFKPLPFDFTRASSGTVVNQSGLIETVGSGIPRIDFLGNTKGALLLEPSRTNSIAYSNDLNASGWNTFSTDGGTVTRTSNYGISPSGKQDSTRVVFTTQFVSLYYSFSGISGDASATMYVKGVAGKVIAFGFGSDVSFGQEFTLNGQWQRIEFNATSTNTTLNINAWGSTRDASDIEVYGVQLEAGSYATSYIPTSGSAVTRVADNPFQREDLASKNLIGSTEFTWFYDCILFYKEGGTSVAPRLGSSSNNQIFVGINVPSTGSTDLRIRHKDGTTASNTSSVPFTNGGRFKIAIKISGTTGNAYINGTNVGTFTTAAAINYNKFSNAINNPNNIIDMKIYNTALTDAELVALTTI